MRFWQSACRDRPSAQASQGEDGLRPRHRRREGPADPRRVRHGRSRRRARGLVHRAGAGLAHAAVRRRAPRAARCRPGSPPSWTAPRFAVAAAGARPGLLRVRRVGRRRGPGPADQPDVRRGLRAALGRHRAGLAAVRAVLPGGQPDAHDPPAASRGSPAATPDAGSSTLPRLGRLLARRARPARVRVARARLPGLDVPLAGAAVVRGVPRDHARRRARSSAARWLERADPFEVYSTLVGHLSVFGRTGATARWCCAARSATSTASRPRPGLVGVVAVLFGSTAFDSFKDSNEWLRFTQSVAVSSTVARHPRPCWCSALVVGVTFSVATMATGVQRGHRRAARCRTCSRTRWCRSSSATSWRTTSATSSRSASRRSCSSATRWATAPNLLGTAELAGQLLALHAPDVPGGAQGARRS